MGCVTSGLIKQMVSVVLGWFGSRFANIVNVGGTLGEPFVNSEYSFG
jgi:hypothetical protein